MVEFFKKYVPSQPTSPKPSSSTSPSSPAPKPAPAPTPPKVVVTSSSRRRSSGGSSSSGPSTPLPTAFETFTGTVTPPPQPQSVLSPAPKVEDKPKITYSGGSSGPSTQLPTSFETFTGTTPKPPQQSILTPDKKDDTPKIQVSRDSTFQKFTGTDDRIERPQSSGILSGRSVITEEDNYSSPIGDKSRVRYDVDFIGPRDESDPSSRPKLIIEPDRKVNIETVEESTRDYEKEFEDVQKKGEALTEEARIFSDRLTYTTDVLKDYETILGQKELVVAKEAEDVNKATSYKDYQRELKEYEAVRGDYLADFGKYEEKFARYKELEQEGVPLKTKIEDFGTTIKSLEDKQKKTQDLIEEYNKAVTVTPEFDPTKATFDVDTARKIIKDDINTVKGNYLDGGLLSVVLPKQIKEKFDYSYKKEILPDIDKISKISQPKFEYTLVTEPKFDASAIPGAVDLDQQKRSNERLNKQMRDFADQQKRETNILRLENIKTPAERLEEKYQETYGGKKGPKTFIDVLKYVPVAASVIGDDAINFAGKLEQEATKERIQGKTISPILKTGVAGLIDWGTSNTAEVIALPYLLKSGTELRGSLYKKGTAAGFSNLLQSVEVIAGVGAISNALQTRKVAKLDFFDGVDDVLKDIGVSKTKFGDRKYFEATEFIEGIGKKKTSVKDITKAVTDTTKQPILRTNTRVSPVGLVDESIGTRRIGKLEGGNLFDSDVYDVAKRTEFKDTVLTFSRGSEKGVIIRDTIYGQLDLGEKGGAVYKISKGDLSSTVFTEQGNILSKFDTVIKQPVASVGKSKALDYRIDSIDNGDILTTQYFGKAESGAIFDGDRNFRTFSTDVKGTAKTRTKGFDVDLDTTYVTKIDKVYDTQKTKLQLELARPGDETDNIIDAITLKQTKVDASDLVYGPQTKVDSYDIIYGTQTKSKSVLSQQTNVKKDYGFEIGPEVKGPSIFDDFKNKVKQKIKPDYKIETDKNVLGQFTRNQDADFTRLTNEPDVISVRENVFDRLTGASKRTTEHELFHAKVQKSRRIVDNDDFIDYISRNKVEKDYLSVMSDSSLGKSQKNKIKSHYDTVKKYYPENQQAEEFLARFNEVGKFFPDTSYSKQKYNQLSTLDVSDVPIKKSSKPIPSDYSYKYSTGEYQQLGEMPKQRKQYTIENDELARLDFKPKTKQEDNIITRIDKQRIDDLRGGFDYPDITQRIKPLGGSIKIKPQLSVNIPMKSAFIGAKMSLGSNRILGGQPYRNEMSSKLNLISNVPKFKDTTKSDMKMMSAPKFDNLQKDIQSLDTITINKQTTRGSYIKPINVPDIKPPDFKPPDFKEIKYPGFSIPGFAFPNLGQGNQRWKQKDRYGFNIKDRKLKKLYKEIGL